MNKLKILLFVLELKVLMKNNIKKAIKIIGETIKFTSVEVTWKKLNWL